MVLKHSQSGLTAFHSKPSVSQASRDGSKQIVIRNSSSRSQSLPRPYDSGSNYSKSSGSNSRCKQLPDQQNFQSHCSRQEHDRSLSSRVKAESQYVKTFSQPRDLPPRPPTTSSRYRGGNRRHLSALELSSSDSISPSSSYEMNTPPSHGGAENIELVGIEDNEGTWAGTTRIAAITGGRETVQQVSQPLSWIEPLDGGS